MKAFLRSWAHYKYKKWQRKTKREEKVKNATLGVLDLMTGLWDLIFLIRAKVVLKINWSVKTPWHEHKNFSLQIMGSWLQRILKINFVKFKYPRQRLTIPSLAQTHNNFFINLPSYLQFGVQIREYSTSIKIQ